MTPLGHCLTPQHFTHFRKKTESREKQWCNCMSHRTPLVVGETSTPGLASKRQEASSDLPSHVSLHNISHDIQNPPSLSSTRSSGATGAAGSVDTPPLLAATSTPGPAAQVVPPSQPAQGHTSSFRLPLIYVDIPSGWEGQMT